MGGGGGGGGGRIVPGGKGGLGGGGGGLGGDGGEGGVLLSSLSLFITSTVVTATTTAITMTTRVAQSANFTLDKAFDFTGGLHVLSYFGWTGVASKSPLKDKPYAGLLFFSLMVVGIWRI